MQAMDVDRSIVVVQDKRERASIARVLEALEYTVCDEKSVPEHHEVLVAALGRALRVIASCRFIDLVITSDEAAYARMREAAGRVATVVLAGQSAGDGIRDVFWKQ